jgi:hypothetical protein
VYIDGQSIIRLVTMGGGFYLAALLLVWSIHRWATRSRRAEPGELRAVQHIAARARARGLNADVASVMLGRMTRDLWGSRLFLHAWAVAQYAVTAAELESMVVHVTLHRRHSHDFLAILLEQSRIDTSQLVADLLIEPDVRLRAVALAMLSRAPRVSPDLRPVLEKLFAVTEGTDRTRALEAILRTYSEEVPPETLLKAAGDHPNPAMRVVLAHELSRWPCQISEACLERLLCDPNWWVRREAAQALLNMGEPGIITLRGILFGKDRYAADMAQQVLNLHRVRRIPMPTSNDQLKQVLP